MILKNERYKGIALILCSAVAFALMGACIKLSGDLPLLQKSFFRNIVTLLCSAAVLRRSGVPFRCPKESAFAMALRCLFGTVGLLGNFYAVDHLMLADANILDKLDPFFCILFSAIFLGEGFTPFQAAAVAGAFGGSLFVIKPTFANANLFPSVVGFIGGVGAGATYTTVRYLGKQRVSPPLIVFYFSLFSSLLALPSLIFAYHPMTAGQTALLLGAGVSATAAQFAVTAAYRYAPASEISVYTYAQVLVSALLGFFLFGQVPDGYSLFGYLLICAMAVLLFLYNRRREQAKAV